MRILLTTTSYQDIPGRHHQMLEDSGHEIIRARGPLSEQQMLELVTCKLNGKGGVDGIIHGNDAITRQVIESAVPQLKALSKYGVGLDKVDLDAAQEYGIPVLFTPGANHTSMAEHVMGLMITMAKDLHTHIGQVKAGRWERILGMELAGKTLGLLGLGRTGKAVAQRAAAFEMNILAYDMLWDEPFLKQHGITKAKGVEDVLHRSDVLSLHLHLTARNRHFLNKPLIDQMKDGAFLINCSRGGLVNETDIAQACTCGKLAGYAADTLEHEPIETPHPFQAIDNIILTPHIAGRTRDSAQRQALMATENLLRVLEGREPIARAA
jgi:D-3-phosphoglycerate dehydrogenase